jgi:hypothetical protein
MFSREVPKPDPKQQLFFVVAGLILSPFIASKLLFASVGDLSLLEAVVVANHLFHIAASFSVSITLQGGKDWLITHSAQLTCSLKSMVVYEKLKEQPNMVTAVSQTL